MMRLFVKASNATHEYLQAIGARVAPDKSHKFASTTAAASWLDNTGTLEYLQTLLTFR